MKVRIGLRVVAEQQMEARHKVGVQPRVIAERSRKWARCTPVK